jgi:hypothetical protein
VEPFGGLPCLTPLGLSLTTIALSFVPWFNNLVSSLKGNCDYSVLWAITQQFVPSKFLQTNVVTIVSQWLFFARGVSKDVIFGLCPIVELLVTFFLADFGDIVFKPNPCVGDVDWSTRPAVVPTHYWMNCEHSFD